MKNNSIHIQLLKIVEKLNDEATRNIEFESQDYIFYPFEFQSDGNVSSVKFMGVVVWDTENERIYDDDKLIDIEVVIKQNVNKFIEEFNRFKI